MNIQEAAMKAQRIGAGIARRDWGPLMYIVPTDTSACCLYIHDISAKRAAIPRWNPSLSDLIATDWIVAGGDRSKELGQEIQD